MIHGYFRLLSPYLCFLFIHIANTSLVNLFVLRTACLSKVSEEMDLFNHLKDAYKRDPEVRKLCDEVGITAEMVRDSPVRFAMM